MARKRSFLENYVTNVPQIVLSYAARLSGVLADVESPGDESGNH